MENLDAGDRQIAMYLRISKQDRTGSKEGSIEHQKKMILNWLHDQQFLQEEENVTQKNYLTDNKNNPTNKIRFLIIQNLRFMQI